VIYDIYDIVCYSKIFLLFRNAIISAMQWYQLDIGETFNRLVSGRQGLSSADAKVRLQKYGFNEITIKKSSTLLRFLRQFHSSLVYILLAAAALTGILTAMGRDLAADTVVILGVVLMNAVLGFFQEGKAEKALEALSSMITPECTVLRDGIQTVLATRELVPGDVVVLSGGDRVPADLRLFFIKDAAADESALTGESIPVEKKTEPLARPNLTPADQSCIAFSGTFLSRGSAMGVVVASGEKTEFGKIASLVKQTEAIKTPLQRKIAEFTRILIIAILSVGAVNFAIAHIFGYSIIYSFLASVSLIVAAIPEMLPMIVTTILALAATVMAKKNALIRRLPAAETLGCTTVICSDKTGTLTKNEMTVKKLYAAGQSYDLSGSGYEPRGEFSIDGSVVDPFRVNGALLETLRAGYDCNNTSLSFRDGRYSVVGDPTEGALCVSAVKAGIREPLKRLDEIPFESEKMYMLTIHEGPSENIIYVKGSPERLLSFCVNQLDGTGLSPLNNEGIQRQVDAMAKQALRVLAMARKIVPRDKKSITDEDAHGLTFLGLQGMMDPPREEAIEAVAKCRSAGIRTVMITGDHVQTAKAVARQLGIIRSAEEDALTGEELALVSDGDLNAVVERVSVYARVAPEHKLRIARQLQSQGHIVAMTGDGVNDAPALKAADIGIAMGITGTEVSKEASGMVLTDDNFATIVSAVEEGRHAWNNLEKAILYTLPTNGGQALLVMGAVLLAPFIPTFGARLPLEPVQILWVNLLDSVFLTMPLMMEPKVRNILSTPPRKADAKIADALFLQRVALIGLAIAVPGFTVYQYFGSPAVLDGKIIDPLLLTQAQTAAFWAVLLVHFGFVMSARSVYQSAFTFSPFSNRWLLLGIAISILTRLLPTFNPLFSSLFRTAEFPVHWWLYIMPCLLPGFIALEVDKWIRRRRGRKY
jgi:Ca2+-transporting ATPase